MIFALARRILLFVSLLFLISFALILLHRIQEGGSFSWPLAGAGAVAAAVALLLSWAGMIKTDDYLTPPHTRIFFIVTGTIAGLLGAGFFLGFVFAWEYAKSYTHYFGVAPAGVAAIYLILIVIKMKEAYVLPYEYRADPAQNKWGMMPIGASVLALAVSAGCFVLTVGQLGFQSRFDASIPERLEEVEELDAASRERLGQQAFRLALAAQEEGSYRRAFKSFQEAAELDHPEADFELFLIFSGEGFLRDLERAREHLQKAHSRGHLEATFRLGKAYRHGELDLEPDYFKANQYLESAAAAGHLEAQTQLGHLHNKGQLGAVDHEKAFHWFLKAAEQGDPVAQNDVGIFYVNGTGVAANPEEGLKWLFKAAEKDITVAIYNLGRLFYEGGTVPQDYSRSLTYFERLAEQNVPYGFQMVGRHHFNGLGVPQDHAAAVEAFAAGSALGDSTSDYYLGYAYLHGLGVERNSSAALTYLESASVRGVSDAQLLLGRLYLEGNLLLQDKAGAAKWFKIAAAGGSEEAAAELEALEPTLSESELADAAKRTAAFNQ